MPEHRRAGLLVLNNLGVDRTYHAIIIFPEYSTSIMKLFKQFRLIFIEPSYEALKRWQWEIFVSGKSNIGNAAEIYIADWYCWYRRLILILTHIDQGRIQESVISTTRNHALLSDSVLIFAPEWTRMYSRIPLSSTYISSSFAPTRTQPNIPTHSCAHLWPSERTSTFHTSTPLFDNPSAPYCHKVLRYIQCDLILHFETIEIW